VTYIPVALLEHAVEAQSDFEYAAHTSYRNESCFTTTEMTNRKRTYTPKVRGSSSDLYQYFTNHIANSINWQDVTNAHSVGLIVIAVNPSAPSALLGVYDAVA